MVRCVRGLLCLKWISPRIAGRVVAVYQVVFKILQVCEEVGFRSWEVTEVVGLVETFPPAFVEFLDRRDDVED